MISKPKIRAMAWLFLLSLTFAGCLGGASSSSQIKPTFMVEGIVNGVTYNSPVIPKINLGDETSLKSVTLNGEAFISGTQITDSGEYTLEVVVENKKGETASGSIQFTSYEDGATISVKPTSESYLIGSNAGLSGGSGVTVLNAGGTWGGRNCLNLFSTPSTDW